MEYTKLTDEQLADLFNSGDKAAFDTLYRRYGQVVQSFARAFYFLGGSIEDLLQEGYLGLFTATRNFDKQRAKESSTSFKTFAYACIKISMMNAVKGKNDIDRIDDETMETIPEDKPSPEDIFISNETLKEITERIGEMLSDFEKQVFELYVKDYKYTEIAEKLDVPAKSVDNALQRIKDKCKQSPFLRSLFDAGN